MPPRPLTETIAKGQPAADEAGLFDRAMSGTRPMRPAAAQAVPPAPPAVKPPPAAKLPAPAPPQAPPARPSGLDRRTAERLRRGQLPIEGTLDLHGHHQIAAHRALNAFIAASQAAGRRCVLVVHGRGDPALLAKPTSEGRGVLRQNVPRWLAEPELAGRILGSAPARPEHGGGGALYVLLRRRRGE